MLTHLKTPQRWWSSIWHCVAFQRELFGEAHFHLDCVGEAIPRKMQVTHSSSRRELKVFQAKCMQPLAPNFQVCWKAMQSSSAVATSNTTPTYHPNHCTKYR